MDYWGAIISVSSAILGVIIGFVLKRITSSGKISLYLNIFNIHYLSQGNTGEILKVQDENEAKFARIFFEIDIHNSSGNNKIIRQLKLDVKNNNKVLNGHLGDVDTKTVSSGQVQIRTPRSFIIPPNSVSSRQFEFVSNEKPPKLENSICYISYINENNKKIRTKLNTESYM